MLNKTIEYGEQFLCNWDGSPRIFWDHQKEDSRNKSKNIIHQGCRDVGKSVCIVTDLLHYAITRKPYFKAQFVSGTVIHFRLSGDYGKTFRSLHVDRAWIDEAAWLPEQAWRAVRQCLNAGGYFRIYSNPNGLRDTTYYRITKEKKRWKLFH